MNVGSVLRRVGFGVALLAYVLIADVGVAGASATVVRGTQGAAVTTCDGSGSLGTYPMSGDLVGCWYTDTFVEKAVSQNGGVFTGTEHFVGCIDTNHNGVCNGNDPTGTFRTTFTFTAKFSTAGEVHGRCHHPIVSGTGAFANVRGEISFHDDVVTGTAPYSGPISL